MAQYSRTVKVAILCCFWYFLSSTNNVIGKKVLRKYPYPLTISMFHMMANAFFTYPLLMLTGQEYSFHYSMHFFWRFVLPLGFGKLLASVSSHVSIWRVSVSYAHTIKASLPIFTVTLARIIYKEKQSYLVYASLLPIVLGVGVATMTEISFEIYGMMSALLATCTFSVQNLYSKSALREVRLNPLQLLMKISQTAFIICVPLWIFIDTPTMSSDESLATYTHQFELISKLTLSAVLNWLQNVVAFSVLNLVSPLSYSVANATKRILVIIVSVVSLKNPVTATNFCGMMLAVLGVFLYNRAKIYQNSRKNILPKTNTDVKEDDYFISPRYRAFHRMNGI